MPEISHVRMAVPEQRILNRILREGGAQSFPQWLYAEPGSEARILWWGLRGAPAPDEMPAGADAGLWPRPVDDWTEAPRGLVLATVDAQRAAADLAPLALELSPNAAPPLEANALVPAAIEPVAVAPVPMAIELMPLAVASVPNAMFVVPVPVDVAPVPIAMLLLPAPPAFANMPDAMFVLASPLAMAP